MKVLVVMPAYNAERTLEATFTELPPDLRDDVLLVDDGSRDQTTTVAHQLGIEVLRLPHNKGYGANQKVCYLEAIRRGYEIAVMLHPDHQYDAGTIPALLEPIGNHQASVVIASRMLEGDPRDHGMPMWRLLGNRGLSRIQNIFYNQDISEYHSGLRAYTTAFLRSIPFLEFSDGFLFDQEILERAVAGGFRLAEVPTLCRYSPESSSISFFGALWYGVGTLGLMRGKGYPSEEK